MIDEINEITEQETEVSSAEVNEETGLCEVEGSAATGIDWASVAIGAIGTAVICGAVKGIKKALPAIGSRCKRVAKACGNRFSRKKQENDERDLENDDEENIETVEVNEK